MRTLNTHVRVTNKQIKEQFDEIDSGNSKIRGSYGIVSDTMPNKKDSPLAVNILIQKVSLQVIQKVSYVHDTDVIVFSYVGNDGNIQTAYLREKENPADNSTEWKYKEDSHETISSIRNAILALAANSLSTYVVNDGSTLIIYGVTNESGFNVENNSNNAISSYQAINVSVNEGTVVFPNGNALDIESAILEFPSALLEGNNDMIMLCVKYDLVDDEVGTNEFGEEEVKTTKVVSSLEFEDADKDLDDNTVCIAVVKVFNNSIHLVDVEGHTYSYNRPWFSPKDVAHRNNVGTAKITQNNPHGIDYDDIDSDNTLHNRLLNDGLILTKPTRVQDIAGLFIVEHISGDSIVPDVDGVLSSYRVRNKSVRYYCLKYKPTHIHKIIRESDQQEIYLKWVENTPYLLCDGINSDDIAVFYSYAQTAQPVIQKTQGVLLNSLYKDDVIFSEGKNVRDFNNTVDIFHKTNIDRYFFVNIDKSGNIETNPKVLVSNTLDMESGDSSSIRERSRLAVFLYNTKCSCELEAPTTGVKYKSNSELNISKANTSYSVNGSAYTPYLDSYTSPAINVFEEVEENEWLEIDMSNDYSNGVRVSNSLHVKKNVINKDSVGFYSSQFTMPINIKKGTATSVTGYIVVTGNSSSVSANLQAQGNQYYLFQETCGDTRVNYIKIDSKIPVNHRSESDLYYLTIESSGSFYVQEIHLEINYDEVRTRYFITQKEDDNKEVTRLLYDSTKEYRTYTSEFLIVEGTTLKIKKSVILYDYLEEASIRDYFFPEYSVKSNGDFNVNITVYGEANDESVSETVEFDDTFREQYGCNFKILNNAFTSVNKYTINNATTEGSVLILAYPLSNYLNPARIMYANYESNTINDYRDIRLCVPTIHNSKDYARNFIAESCNIDIA